MKRAHHKMGSFFIQGSIGTASVAARQRLRSRPESRHRWPAELPMLYTIGGAIQRPTAQCQRRTSRTEGGSRRVRTSLDASAEYQHKVRPIAPKRQSPAESLAHPRCKRWQWGRTGGVRLSRQINGSGCGFPHSEGGRDRTVLRGDGSIRTARGCAALGMVPGGAQAGVEDCAMPVAASERGGLVGRLAHGPLGPNAGAATWLHASGACRGAGECQPLLAPFTPNMQRLRGEGSSWLQCRHQRSAGIRRGLSHSHFGIAWITPPSHLGS